MTMAPPDPEIQTQRCEADSVSLASSNVSDSLTTTMAAGAALMKEEDAALLERGVRDSCSSGQTPIIAPISPPPTNRLPMLGPSSTADKLNAHASPVKNLSMNESRNPSTTASLASTSPRGLSRATGLNEKGNNLLQSEDKPSANGRYFYRRCLSGEVRPSTAIHDSDKQSCPCDDCMSASPISVAEEVRSPSPSDSHAGAESENAPKSVSGLGPRSKSFDRRLSEAMQFAEALGERPPADQSEVQVIIEETESDYDDDSDIEVHIDSPSAAPDSKLPDSNGENMSALSNTKPPMKETPESDELFIPAVLRKQKSRPRWPFPDSNGLSESFLHKLPHDRSGQNFVYKGICSNPPEITKRGISRGNYAQLHRKAWLEVSDKYHRYGKNLRLYYKYWESLGYPTNQFFDWLDSKGEAAGQPLPNLDECPRSQLDSDTVLYITNPDVADGYALSIVTDDKGRASVLDVDGDPVNTGPDGWIFVLRDNTLYGAEKIASVTGQSKQRFHHSSFFGGKAVAAAGILITNEEGILTRLYPHSGHYRPGEADMQRMLFHLHHKGVDLRTFEMDTQQILHVSRHEPLGKKDESEKKKKKTQSLHLMPAVFVACFLAQKARFIGEGVFDQIHMIRKTNVTSVTEALEECDAGGFWSEVRGNHKRA